MMLLMLDPEEEEEGPYRGPCWTDLVRVPPPRPLRGAGDEGEGVVKENSSSSSEKKVSLASLSLVPSSPGGDEVTTSGG